MLTPSTVTAKVVAIAILLIFLLAGNQFIAQPMLRAYQDNKAEISQLNELLQRYQALVDEKPKLTERLSAWESADATNTAYLDGASDALAAAELQELASEAIEIAGGEIKSTQSLTVVEIEERPALRRTGVTFRFSTDIDGLAEALYDLETSEPLLFISALQVSAKGRRQKEGEEEKPQPLDVRLDVYGYARQAQ